jgi:sodium/hydrogen antiporter
MPEARWFGQPTGCAGRGGAVQNGEACWNVPSSAPRVQGKPLAHSDGNPCFFRKPAVTMQFAEPWLFVLCVAALLVVLGATAGLVNNRLWISEPLACTAVGVALGYFGLPHLSPGLSGAASPLLREAARVTLAIAVTGAAMRIPRGWARGHWAGLAVALGPGMLAMWMTGSVIATAAFGWPALTCLLVGAAIAPTDPVLASPIVSGRLARDHIPADLRHALTVESGANDGLSR